MIQALETIELGFRYGKTWALRDCNLTLPIGRVAGLVGPNGAGKTTLLHLAAGLLKPDIGSIRVFGASPHQQPQDVLPRIGFVAQSHPLYRSFTVKELLTLGRKLNPDWDNDFACKRLEHIQIPLKRLAGKLSSGQQAQVALVLAIAKRPEMLILDEPLATLDPLARREFQQTLMAAVAERGLTVLFSSHLVADMERFCDYLVILAASHVQVASDIELLLRTHKRLVGPCERAEAVARTHTVIEASTIGRMSTLFVRSSGAILDPAWEVWDVSLEDIILAYLAHPDASILTRQTRQREKSLSVDMSVR